MEQVATRRRQARATQLPPLATRLTTIRVVRAVLRKRRLLLRPLGGLLGANRLQVMVGRVDLLCAARLVPRLDIALLRDCMVERPLVLADRQALVVLLHGVTLRALHVQRLLRRRARLRSARAVAMTYLYAAKAPVVLLALTGSLYSLHYVHLPPHTSTHTAVVIVLKTHL